MKNNNDKPLDQSTMDAILSDINRYLFQDATPDNPARNQGLAREIIVRYGPRISTEGSVFAMIEEYLQSQPNLMAFTQALNRAPELFNYAFDFVSARGDTEAGYILLTIITNAPKEDITALAALTYASPNFVNKFAKAILERRFKSVEGTSCKMSLALALYQCGDDRQLNKFIHAGYLKDHTSVGEGASLVDKSIEKGTTSIYARLILKILLEDIATNGRGFAGPLAGGKPWKRKQHY